MRFNTIFDNLVVAYFLDHAVGPVQHEVHTMDNYFAVTWSSIKYFLREIRDRRGRTL